MSSMTDNIVHTGQPSQSSVRVAIARAAHQLLDEPMVFDDPFALPVLGRETERMVRENPFQFNDPAQRTMRAALVARSRLAEDEVREAVQRGVRQYLVLGAGMDTFSLRNPHAAAGLRTWEVDHPCTQAFKRAALARAGIALPEEASFVAVDFERNVLAEKLRETGFRTDVPACIAWLGVAAYLSEDAVMRTLAFAASLPAGSSIVFDYRVPAARLNPLERVMEEHAAAMFAAMGEPWKSTFDPPVLEEALRKMGFSILEDLGARELNARYFHRRKDGLQTAGGGFRCLRARTGAPR